MDQARTTTGTDGSRGRRLVVLLALGVVCALVLAPPLRLYVEQQQDIAALRAELDQRETDVALLETEVGLWDDEAYVAAQARERLNFVMPGETGYVVPEPEPSTDGSDGSAGSDGESSSGGDGTPSAGDDVEAVLRPDAAPQGTWYGRLWSSVEATGTGASDPVLDAPVVGGDD